MIVDYTIDEKGSLIHIFKEGKRYVERFTPYFYEPSGKGKYISISGEKAIRIETTYPKEVPKIRSPKSYESDVLFNHRWMLDRLKSIQTTYSFLCLDIENSAENMPPEREMATNGHSRIFSIALLGKRPWDRKLVKVVLYLRPEGSTIKKIKYKNAQVVIFDTEVEMLQFLVQAIKKFDPDILTGWNSDNYDIPYLINRMNRLGVIPELGRDGSIAKVKPIYNDEGKIKGQRLTIWGRAVMDALTMYRNKRPKQMRSWRLEYISRIEGLETPKFELPGSGSDKYENAWRNNPELLVDYNFHDVLSATELFERDLPHFMLVQSLAFCPIDKTIGQNSVTGSVLLRIAGQKTPKIILPRGQKVKARKIPGGKVLDPKPGYWEEVDILDFVSYYPNIIRTLNLSYETYLPNGGGLQLFNGYSFDQSRRGLLPEAMDLILPERFKYKALAAQNFGTPLWQDYNDRQKALKVLADGMYGATKNGFFRLHSIPVAETITMTGQEGTTIVAEIVETQYKGINVGGDTDSVMAQTTTDADKIVKDFDFELFLPRLCWGDMPKENTIELHWDGEYPRFFQTSEKKHYFAINEKDKLIQKGFYKSDLPAFSENFQNTIFRGILDNNGRFPDDEYYRYKREFMDFDLEKIGFPGKFPGKTEFKKAVRYAENYLELSFLPFDRPLQFKVESTGSLPYTQWIAVNDIGDIPSQIKIDRESMWKKMVSMALGRTVTSMIEDATRVW